MPASVLHILYKLQPHKPEHTLPQLQHDLLDSLAKPILIHNLPKRPQH